MDPNAVVSTTIDFEPPLDRPPTEMMRAEGGLSVQLEGGRRARLDPTDSRSAGFAQVLDGLRKQRLPVYVEFDPDTGGIVRLLIPYVARVVGIRPFEDDALSVELEPSHARHLLRRGHEDFEELERLLERALTTREPMIVTEDDAHEIIDVRAYPGRPDVPPLLPAGGESERRPPMYSFWHWLRKLVASLLGKPRARAPRQ